MAQIATNQCAGPAAFANPSPNPSAALHSLDRVDAVDGFAEAQATLENCQERLMGLAGSLIARRVVSIFDSTPRLKRLRLSFDYSTSTEGGVATRLCTVTAQAEFATKVLLDGIVSNALERPLWLPDTREVGDVEGTFNRALEQSPLIRALGPQLDVGRTVSQIDVTRRLIAQHRDPRAGRTHLVELARRILAF